MLRPLQPSPCRQGEVSGRTCPSLAHQRLKKVKKGPLFTARATPHSGYHFDGTSRRFFEGWYWKVTIPENGQSFALIYSVEDPGDPTSKAGGVGVQVMGPDDGYICQHTRDTRTFWADRGSLALGATLKAKPGVRQPISLMPPAEFERRVEQGFQASTTMQQGAIIADEQSAPGAPLSRTLEASWNLAIKPIFGWGGGLNDRDQQKATAGWLSVLAVFEPHWQVLMSHGLATGWLQWGSQRYEFKDAPTYGEKNFGAGFPSKWHWVQCNTFEGQPNLSLTAVGARRQLLVGVPGVEEDVGMIGLHWEGQFIELVPWAGEVEWDVDPWGRWFIHAEGDKYHATVEATCKPDAGAVLRAPTSTEGLAAFCKDTFFGNCRLRVWRVGADGKRVPKPFIDATSTTAALEVGGGPWWSAWKAKAAMKEPLKTLVQLPLDVAAISRMIPAPLRPPGL